MILRLWMVPNISCIINSRFLKLFFYSLKSFEKRSCFVFARSPYYLVLKLLDTIIQTWTTRWLFFTCIIKIKSNHISRGIFIFIVYFEKQFTTCQSTRLFSWYYIFYFFFFFLVVFKAVSFRFIPDMLNDFNFYRF